MEDPETLRIRRVHIPEASLFFLLSDGRVLGVPTSVSPALAAATLEQTYQWRLVDEGRGVEWYGRDLVALLSLRTLLAHPGAEIRDPG